MLSTREEGETLIDLSKNPHHEAAEKKLVSDLIQYSIERKVAEEILKRRTIQLMRHQKILLELVKMSRPTLDAALQKITEADAQTLEVERVSVWFFTEDRSEIVCKNLYTLSDKSHEKGMRLQAQQYPRYFQALEATRILAVTDACSDPRTSEFAETYLNPLRVTSMMDVPIWCHGKLVGIVCHEHTGSERVWEPEEQDFAGSISDMISLALESSERKLAEERFQLVAWATSDAVWDWDLTTDAVWWNEGVRTLFGYLEKDVGPGAAWWVNHIHPEDKERVVTGIHRLIQSGGRFWSDEYRYCRADGSTAYVFDRGYVIHDEKKPVRMIGAMMDITERKVLEKMKDDLFRDAAHELRTPYAMIKMGLDMMERGFRQKDRRRIACGKKIIGSNVTRMEHDVENILDIFKIESSVSQEGNGKRTVPVSGFFKETAKSYVPQIEAKGLKFRLDVQRGLPPLQMARHDLLRVLRNVLDNAIKFTDHGKIVLTVRRKNGSAMITVQDTGKGIRTEDLKRVFERFFKGQPGLQGVGLGLPIAKLLLEQVGGRITVDSPELGRGTTVEITVPLVERKSHKS